MPEQRGYGQAQGGVSAFLLPRPGEAAGALVDGAHTPAESLEPLRSVDQLGAALAVDALGAGEIRGHRSPPQLAAAVSQALSPLVRPAQTRHQRGAARPRPFAR